MKFLLNVGAALLFAGTSAWAANGVAAHQTKENLPTLSLEYYFTGDSNWSLDPAIVNSTTTIEVTELTNAGLVHLLPNGRVLPDLATWTTSRNQLVYTFTLRRNARFSNGHEVTAGDAAFSLKRFLSVPTPAGSPPPSSASSAEQ